MLPLRLHLVTRRSVIQLPVPRAERHNKQQAVRLASPNPNGGSNLAIVLCLARYRPCDHSPGGVLYPGRFLPLFSGLPKPSSHRRK